MKKQGRPFLPEEERIRRRKESIAKYRNSLKFKIASRLASKRYYYKKKNKNKEQSNK